MMEIGEANVRCLARSDKWSHLRDTGHPRRIRKFRECSVFLFLRLCENNPSPGPFGERFLVARCFVERGLPRTEVLFPSDIF